MGAHSVTQARRPAKLGKALSETNLPRATSHGSKADIVFPSCTITAGGSDLEIVKSVDRYIVRAHHIRASNQTLKYGGGADVWNTGTLSYCLILIQKGEVAFQQWSSAKTLYSNDILIMTNWIPYEFAFGRNTEALIYIIPAWWAVKELFDKNLSNVNTLIPHSFLSAKAISALAKDLFQENVPKEQQRSGVLMLTDLLRRTIEQVANRKELIPDAKGRMGRLFSIILRNCHKEGFSQQDAASQLKCSVRTIQMTCAENGTSFGRLLMDARMNWAAYRLTAGTERISEIAYGCGFISLSHFCRLFKARFGISANRYRAENAQP